MTTESNDENETPREDEEYAASRKAATEVAVAAFVALLTGAIAGVAREIAGLDDENVNWPDSELPKDCFVCTQCGMSIQELEANRRYGGRTGCKEPFFPFDPPLQHKFRYRSRRQT